MAEQKHAELICIARFSEDTRLLSFRTATELGFLGGQYTIVDTGIPLAGNKIAKRSYSILSSDNIQDEFQIAVKRLGDGPGSNFMHRMELGAELKFSGPWGKLVADGTGGDVLVFATAQALPKSAFLAGDGSVIYPLRNRLIEAGMHGESIRLECFFNNPERKAAA